MVGQDQKWQKRILNKFKKKMRSTNYLLSLTESKTENSKCISIRHQLLLNTLRLIYDIIKALKASAGEWDRCIKLLMNFF